MLERYGSIKVLWLRRHIRSENTTLLFVGNQHKWDRLGPEKIIIMKSCVGAP